MNKKISLGVAVAIVIAFVTATFAITMSVSQRIYNKLISDLQGRIETYSLIDELDSVVRENYYGEVSPGARNSNMLAGYVDSLEDNSCVFLAPAAYSSYISSINGEISGIGINCTFDFESGYICVTSVFNDSPAESAGIKEGDLISVIDGEAVTKDNYEQLINSLYGKKLTSVKITFIHDNSTKTVSVMMGYSSKSVSYKEAGLNTAYIKIDGFYANTAQQLSDVIDNLDKDVTSIIFDVRGTSSGTIQYTTDVLKLLVPVASEGSGALATEIDKNGNTTYYESNASCVSGIKMIVLTDSETASCGELFACDLHDFGLAALVGEKTQGNANVQKAFQLSDGSGVILCVAKVKPYITETFDEIGISPDIEVESSAQTVENDVQLEAAINYLSSNP